MAVILVKNAARCRKCGTYIESKHVHDFVLCKCGAIFVDGGLEYQRFGGAKENFEDLAEYDKYNY